ncbi:MAG: hypothetical protein LBD82_07750, partial [Deltaproteobacteria bacterium]|nr:hypothetical protein [Deltaproteobacteria bacterium]
GALLQPVFSTTPDGSRTPGANARSTVELVLGFIFALARGVVPAHNRLMRGEWAHTLGMELYGKTLGIIGLGHIGTMLAEAARALGMEVAAHSRAPKPALVERLGLRQVGLEELLRLADFVSLNLPALPGGPPLIGRKEIALMKPGAYLINAARGQLLDYDALTEALAEGRLAGAGLDVFPHEPMSLQRMEAMRHPLFSLPNVVCTPHDGGMTGEAVDRVSLMNLQDLEQFLKGERSPRAINPQVYAGGCA